MHAKPLYYDIICIMHYNTQQLGVTQVPFDWLEDQHHTRDVWKYASTTSGERSVMTDGMMLMLWLSVDN